MKTLHLKTKKKGKMCAAVVPYCFVSLSKAANQCPVAVCMSDLDMLKLQHYDELFPEIDSIDAFFALKARLELATRNEARSSDESEMFEEDGAMADDEEDSNSDTYNDDDDDSRSGSESEAQYIEEEVWLTTTDDEAEEDEEEDEKKEEDEEKHEEEQLPAFKDVLHGIKPDVKSHLLSSFFGRTPLLPSHRHPSSSATIPEEQTVTSTATSLFRKH